MRELAELLEKVYFFRGLSAEDLQSIQLVSHEARFQPGEVIFREGAEADRFYIVLSGAVEVWKENDLLAVHTAGHLFGEMALIDEVPRSATVIAREAAQLAYIGRADFQQIIRRNSQVAISIIRSVSDMVRTSNEHFLESLRARNLELERTNLALREAQEELLRKERLSTLGKFSSLILHDIRNPISVLRSLAELILLAADDHERVQRNARKIIAESERLNQLASELLDYSRGDTRLNPSIVRLGEFFDRLRETIAERFQARGIAVNMQLDFPGPAVLDENRLFRVFLNLADNAWKAMPKGGEMRIRVWKDGGTLRAEVGDTGVGMTPEVQARIFEPFFSSSEMGGTGLGMAIVKSIVEAHHGTVSFCSERNKGTTFRLSIPLVD
jgi:signal transduction histidine kinase